MGWSCTAVAHSALQRIEDACKRTRQGTSETSCNVYSAGGKRYFYEVARRDLPDGGITGTIHLSWEDSQGIGWCRQVGTFRIDGHGFVRRGPKLFKDTQASPAGCGEQEANRVGH